MPGAIWSLWAFATAGYRRRLLRENSPKGTTPTPRGPSGTWDAKVDWVARGPMVRSRGHPCPVGRPKDPRGLKLARRRAMQQVVRDALIGLHGPRQLRHKGKRPRPLSSAGGCCCSPTSGATIPLRQQ